MRKLSKTLTLLFIINLTAYGQVMIDHTPLANTSGSWRNLGFGQSFTIPAGATCMDQLTIYMVNFSINNGFDAQFTIYNGEGMSGSIAYGPVTVNINTASAGVNVFGFTSIAVTPGDKYTYEFTYPFAADGGIYAYVKNEHDDTNDTYPGGISYRNGVQATSSNVTNYDDLFMIHCVVPLPVELVNFTAKNVEDRFVQLDWQTLSEKNNDYFTIERSQDAQNWELVSEVDGAGNSNEILDYNTTDEDPLTGTTYYRLKQTDFDGEFAYSKIIAVHFGASDIDNIKVFPNPATQFISVNGNENDISEYSILSILGQDMNASVQLISKNESQILLDISKLPTGIYFIKTKSSVSKFNKQ